MLFALFWWTFTLSYFLMHKKTSKCNIFRPSFSNDQSKIFDVIQLVFCETTFWDGFQKVVLIIIIIQESAEGGSIFQNFFPFLISWLTYFENSFQMFSYFSTTSQRNSTAKCNVAWIIVSDYVRLNPYCWLLVRQFYSMNNFLIRWIIFPQPFYFKLFLSFLSSTKICTKECKNIVIITWTIRLYIVQDICLYLREWNRKLFSLRNCRRKSARTKLIGL